MDSQLYLKATEEGACVDLSDRAKWRLAGADRVRYLNGQVTNDVRTASANEAMYACVTNVKGRIEGDLFIHADPTGGSLLLDGEPAAREPLGLRLEKYIIADDAELVDVTYEWLLWHVFGQLEPGAWRMETEAAGGHVVAARRFGVAGIDLWLPAMGAEARSILALLHSSHALLSSADAEDFRILQQIPRYPHELNAEGFPAEAGLEQRGMSFTKGCYIGQEILSRIKTTGKMPRELVAWEAAGTGTEVAEGDSLFAAADQKPVGSVTSVTRHPLRGVFCGLAYVRQGMAGAHSVLLVGSDVPRIESTIRILPLVHP